LFVIAGGDDDTSRVKMEDLVRRVKSGGIAIYPIGLLNSADRDEKKSAEHALNELAQASGGIASYPRDAEHADDLILKLSARFTMST
jgi:hypothetical protein